MPTIVYTDGAETVSHTTATSDTLIFLGGNDRLNVFTGTVQAFMGEGDDLIDLRGGTTTAYGESGNDRFELLVGATVYGGGGADLFTVKGGTGLVAEGGEGEDRFNFGAVALNVLIHGGVGDDNFSGYNFASTGAIHGDSGNDTFNGFRAGMTLHGGGGNDVYRVNPVSSATFVELLGDGTDVVQLMRGADYVLPDNIERIIVGTYAGSDISSATITMNALNNAFTGHGNDETVNGLGGNDQIFGKAGNDTLDGDDGNDLLDGGTGNDSLIGGSGNDRLVGRAGDDTMIGGPGDDTYYVDSLSDVVTELLGGGTDTVRTTLTLTLVPNVENGVLEGTADLNLTGNAGNNQLFGNSGLNTLGGADGNDILRGGGGNDVLLGGNGVDIAFGDQGSDTALLGAGNDIFHWDPGDGSDIVEGQADTDLLRFNGSNASETINIMPNGARVIYFRDVANITMDLDDVEVVRYNAFGGIDNVVISDMTGTDLTRAEISLAASAGGGDGQSDRVTVNATIGADVFGISNTGSEITVFGLAAQTLVYGAEPTDTIVLNAQGSDDVINATDLAAGLVTLEINGGIGQDLVIGSDGVDRILGGDGNDTALMGSGNDTFVWNPGDDNDTIEGQDGTDTLLFNGSAVAENISISANGGRVIFFRDVANVVMDLNDTEVIEYNALGGADTITVNDLSGTDADTVRISLGVAGVGDGQVDTVVINATANDDYITVTNTGTSVVVSGLSAEVQIFGFEPTDVLIINTLGGFDLVDGGALGAAVSIRANGGVGADTLHGGAGADFLTGGVDDDTFDYDSVGESTPAAQDSIDYIFNSDTIDLSTIDANPTVAGNQAFANALLTPTAYSVWLTNDGGMYVLNADITGDTIADLQINTNSNTIVFADIIF